MSDSGMAILTTTIPLATSKSARSKSGVQVRGQSIHVAVDESEGVPVAFASILAMGSGDVYKPANRDAIFWAEKYQPKLFAGLVDHLQSYLGLSVNERTAVGGAKAVLDLLKSGFESTFNTGKLEGVIAGFQSRMTVEPVGNLHL